ncbi:MULTISPECIES: glycosyltransferase [unclassified Sphingobium]|uniref:glycosyltransferase n=1 Tax=unclassified Sphingobium TaxID=2611147 RepID=UPI002223F21F|nr:MULTISPECIES: glycosyltransferase [unclassified Sphingobium]MCW2411755.1 glycosyltransferase involved in cell wall biosynthesis [Sphingobium sp. B8D3D]MCW2415949.1 glycosyltransferase involved in cell wall biosynthesis [Sphingobium sp. B8D3A]
MNYTTSRSAFDELTVRFPGANLSQIDARSSSRKLRVGWYIKDSDANSASARYRCFHFARVLEGEFENIFISNFKDMKSGINELDAVIIVKRLDQSTIELAALARLAQKPIFLDLCDDVAHPLHSAQKAPYASLTSLVALAPVLSGIVTPSAEMAERLQGYLLDNRLSGPPCHVIPDIAETRALFEATERFVRSKRSFPYSAPLLHTKPNDSSAFKYGRKKILWFGNYGGQHSNFGIFSLKPKMKHLREFHQKFPIELTVISNSEIAYESLVIDCGFPTRYVEWSSSSVYDELEQTDAVLLSTGDDEFCNVKSSNRALQALAASVPVISEKSSALTEFEDIIFSAYLPRSLHACLGPDSESKIRTKLDLAEPILQRYTPERLVNHWSNLLKSAISKSLLKRASNPPTGALLVLDSGDDPDDAFAAIAVMNQAFGSNYDLLVSLDLLSVEPTFHKALYRAKPLPKFFSGNLGRIEAQVSRRAAIIVGELSSISGQQIVKLAEQLGAEVLTHGEAAVAGLERFGTSAAFAPAAAVRPPEGRYPEHTDPDGSVEWAFVIHNKAKGWILDAICQEIGSRQPDSWKVVDHSRPPPISRNLFLTHPSLLNFFDSNYPEALATRNVFVWYTHPREETAESIARNLTLFNGATRIIFTCESNRRLWIERGLAPEKAVVVLGAADPSLFRGHQRGGGVVGLSSSFYERKNPDLLLSVIKALPHRNFVLLGRHWNRYALFEEMLALPNFTYMTRPYRDYPQIYRMFDVFLSISSLEGGPIPLVEAMMCNAVPVASRTGFAPDLIVHGENGFLFEIDEGTSRVSDLIEQAFALDTDVRATVERYSWDQFSAEIIGLAL